MPLVGLNQFRTLAVTIVAASIWSIPAHATQSVEQEKSDNSNGSFILKVIEKEPETITDKRHPDYVKCRTESIIGSLARKRRVCMTNKEWVDAARRGNRFADDAISAIQGMSGGGSDANNGQ